MTPTYSLKYQFCDSPDCPDCINGKGHGPFWYATIIWEGQEHTILLGKDFRPLNPETDLPHSSSSTDTSRANTARNRFPGSRPPGNILSDPVEPDRPRRGTEPNGPLPDPVPPSKGDFEHDVHRLTASTRDTDLKTIYRQLIKKYHPDKYPGNIEMTAWMAEINGRYQQCVRAGIR